MTITLPFFDDFNRGDADTLGSPYEITQDAVLDPTHSVFNAPPKFGIRSGTAQALQHPTDTTVGANIAAMALVDPGVNNVDITWQVEGPTVFQGVCWRVGPVYTPSGDSIFDDSPDSCYFMFLPPKLGEFAGGLYYVFPGGQPRGSLDFNDTQPGDVMRVVVRDDMVAVLRNGAVSGVSLNNSENQDTSHTRVGFWSSQDGAQTNSLRVDAAPAKPVATAVTASVVRAGVTVALPAGSIVYVGETITLHADGDANTVAYDWLLNGYGQYARTTDAFGVISPVATVSPIAAASDWHWPFYPGDVTWTYSNPVFGARAVDEFGVYLGVYDALANGRGTVASLALELRWPAPVATLHVRKNFGPYADATQFAMNETVRFDLTSSVGIGADLTIRNAVGDVVQHLVSYTAPFVTTYSFSRPGHYTATAVISNDRLTDSLPFSTDTVVVGFDVLPPTQTVAPGAALTAAYFNPGPS